MPPTPTQQNHGSSPVVNVAAWLFILVVSVPIGCAVLFFGGFWLVVAASQLPGWLTDAAIVLAVVVGLTAQAVALSRVVRGWLRRR